MTQAGNFFATSQGLEFHASFQGWIANLDKGDTHTLALDEILREETSARKFATRVKNLREGNGSIDLANGSYRLNQLTVSDDDDEDVLTGSAGEDWFLFLLGGENKDKVTDLSVLERVSAIFSLDDLEFLGRD